MVQISQVSLFSLDKSDGFWAIEGEILFESDLNTGFSANYIPEYDELEYLEIAIDAINYDEDLLKEMILEAVANYEE